MMGAVLVDSLGREGWILFGVCLGVVLLEGCCSGFFYFL